MIQKQSLNTNSSSFINP